MDRAQPNNSVPTGASNQTNSVPPTSGQSQPTPKPQASFSTIRTFKNDVSSAVKGENVSLASMALKESQKRDRDEQSVARESNKTTIALVASFLIFMLSVGLVVYFAFIRKVPETSVTLQTTRDSLVFADSHTNIDTTHLRPLEIVRAVSTRLYDTNRRIGTIEDIYFTKKVTVAPPDGQTATAATTQDIELDATTFFASISSHIPSALTSLLDPQFMYGIHAFSANSGFLMFTTDSYAAVYAQLLAWEKRYMATDLTPILYEGTLPNDFNTGNWVDSSYKNIATRELRDADGKIVLMYAFLNPTHFVITGGQDAFNEVLSRYTTPKPVIR